MVRALQGVDTALHFVQVGGPLPAGKTTFSKHIIAHTHTWNAVMLHMEDDTCSSKVSHTSLLILGSLEYDSYELAQ